MKALRVTLSVCVLAGLLASAAVAVNIETVPVGNPANAGELSGSGAGGFGPDRICGSVGYTYNIGKYEVTAGQYTEFLNAVARADPYGLYNADMGNISDDVLQGFGCNIQRSGTSGNYTYSVASGWANRPVNYVSYWDSCRFANWMHNGQGAGSTETGAYSLNGVSDPPNSTIARNPGARVFIPSEDEWYKAAYYKGGSTNAGYFDYPTGSDSVPGRDMNDASGNNANYYGTPYPIDSPYYTTVAGEFQNSDSPYGTFDQGGNVWEWNEAVLYGSNRCLRGGTFRYVEDAVGFLHASWRGNGRPPGDEYNTVGFRIAFVPEPATLLLLALGGLAAMRQQPSTGS